MFYPHYTSLSVLQVVGWDIDRQDIQNLSGDDLVVWEMAERLHSKFAIEVNITTEVVDHGPTYLFDLGWNPRTEKDRRFGRIMYQFTLVELS